MDYYEYEHEEIDCPTCRGTGLVNSLAIDNLAAAPSPPHEDEIEGLRVKILNHRNSMNTEFFNDPREHRLYTETLVENIEFCKSLLDDINAAQRKQP